MKFSEEGRVLLGAEINLENPWEEEMGGAEDRWVRARRPEAGLLGSGKACFSFLLIRGGSPACPVPTAGHFDISQMLIKPKMVPPGL